MEIEKKDWEVIKKEAETQIKNAMITLALNQVVLDTATLNIQGYKVDNNNNTATLKKDNGNIAST